MATDKRPTMLRLPESTYEKVRYLAYVERRSINMEIEHAIENYITDYERDHGSIPILPGHDE
jgi:predicted DNA-binding protein